MHSSLIQVEKVCFIFSIELGSYLFRSHILFIISFILHVVNPVKQRSSSNLSFSYFQKHLLSLPKDISENEMSHWNMLSFLAQLAWKAGRFHWGWLQYRGAYKIHAKRDGENEPRHGQAPWWDDPYICCPSSLDCQGAPLCPGNPPTLSSSQRPEEASVNVALTVPFSFLTIPNMYFRSS